MAFDFPDAPTVGDEFTSGGATYTWTGLVWDLASSGNVADKVDKAGDTMTGALTIDGVPSGSFLKINSPTGTFNNRLEGKKAGVTRWTLDLGSAVAENTSNAGSDFVIYRFQNNGTSYARAMQINRADGRMSLDAGVSLGSVAVTDPKDVTRHLALYGTTFGFSITGSTLNYNVSTGAKHDFLCDGVTQLRVQAGTSNMYSNFHCAGTITSGVTQGNNAINLNDGARINLSNDCLIYKNYGSNDFMFHNKSSQVFTFHISGTGDVYVIDTIGATGNSVNVTAPESLAIGAELGVACEHYDKGDRIDVMKVVAALLLKVKALEAKLEAR